MYACINVLLVFFSGDILQWEQQIRLRHMTTRKYLCIDITHEIMLTDDNEDPRTVFRLHSVINVRLSFFNLTF